MTDREEKLMARLSKVRKNIEDSRRLIAYHKKMLKTYKRKEKELSERIEKAQLDDLFKAVKDGNCDISEINKAIQNGEFVGIAETAIVSDENKAATANNISYKKGEDNS